MTERAILIRVRPGLYRAHSRSTRSRSYKINVAYSPRLGWTAVCDCPGCLSHHHCYHCEASAYEEYEHMVNENRAVVVYDRLPVPVLDPGTILPSTILPAPSEIAAMVQIANLMTPDEEDPRETFKLELAGWELGVGPMTAIRRMFNVGNKIEPDAQLMLALALAKDETLSVKFEGDATKCRATLTRRGKKHDAITYTIEDAHASGQTTVKDRYNKFSKKWEKGRPGPWQHFPADMLRHSAAKRVLRLYAPDLINNVKGAPLGQAEAMIIDVSAGDNVRDAIELQEREGALDEASDFSTEPTWQPTDDGGGDPIDVTNYNAVVKSLLEEGYATTDADFFTALIEELCTVYKYVGVKSGKKWTFKSDKLRPEDAKAVAELLTKRLLGGGPGDNEDETATDGDNGGESATDEEQSVDPDDLPFE